MYGPLILNCVTVLVLVLNQRFIGIFLVMDEGWFGTHPWQWLLFIFIDMFSQGLVHVIVSQESNQTFYSGIFIIYFCMNGRLVLNQRFLMTYLPLVFNCVWHSWLPVLVLNQCFIAMYSPLIFVWVSHRLALNQRVYWRIHSLLLYTSPWLIPHVQND